MNGSARTAAVAAFDDLGRGRPHPHEKEEVDLLLI